MLPTYVLDFLFYPRTTTMVGSAHFTSGKTASIVALYKKNKPLKEIFNITSVSLRSVLWHYYTNPCEMPWECKKNLFTYSVIIEHRMDANPCLIAKI